MITMSTEKTKSWIILKSKALLEFTENVFNGTGIRITTEGKRHFGALREKYASDKVEYYFYTQRTA